MKKYYKTNPKIVKQILQFKKNNTINKDLNGKFKKD